MNIDTNTNIIMNNINYYINYYINKMKNITNNEQLLEKQKIQNENIYK